MSAYYCLADLKFRAFMNIPKRTFDIVFSFLGLVTLGWFIVISTILASISTRSNGVFIQSRVGQYGRSFQIFKIKTFSDRSGTITSFGAFLRSTKIDELPQLYNILVGEMSFVGPRPDIAGYADLLEGDDRIILSIKPGLSGLASLKYRNEQAVLKQQDNPLFYNNTIIWPDKVRINKWYAKNYNLSIDLIILFFTVVPINFDVEQFMQEKFE